MKHGTPSGYTYHGCRCEACTTCQREYQRRYRGSVTKTTVATSRRARNVAAERLIERHPEEFQRLLEDEVAREVSS